MSTTIKFKNQFGEEITNQQKDQMNVYAKIFYEDGIETKYEMYKNGSLVGKGFYVDSEAEIAGLLPANPDAVFIYAVVSGDYELQYSDSYVSSSIAERAISVADSEDNIVCFSKLYYELGVETGKTTEKSFYDAEGERYAFTYESDGACEMIWDRRDDFDDIHPIDVGNIEITDFTWDSMEYYQNADPIDPNDLIV